MKTPERETERGRKKEGGDNRVKTADAQTVRTREERKREKKQR